MAFEADLRQRLSLGVGAWDPLQKSLVVGDRRFRFFVAAWQDSGEGNVVRAWGSLVEFRLDRKRCLSEAGL